MSQLLRTKGVSSYIGIDIFSAGIIEARKKYPNNTFLIGDFLAYDFPNQFDFVFCSGALTTRLHSNNYDVLPHWLERMWRLAKYGFSFNFLAEEKQGQFEEDLFLYNIKRVFTICDQTVPNATRIAHLTRTGDRREYLQVHIYLYP